MKFSKQNCPYFFPGITPEKVICDKSRAYIQETMMNIIAEAGKK